MQQFLKDRRASYGAFILLGAFVVCIVTIGYFITSAGIYSSIRGEALGHSSTYQSISRQDLMRILEKATLVASMEGGENAWDETQVNERFKEISEEWITSYLEERGVYDIEITVEEKSEIKEKDKETYIDLGKYIIIISGQGAKTEMVID